MQALLFEMTPRLGHEDHYFAHAARLRPLVMQHDGLLHLERFKSLARPNVILSHSLWRDEAAIAQWRTDREHMKSQTAGRYEHFEDYRIQISHVLTQQLPRHAVQNWSRDGLYANVDPARARHIAIFQTSEQRAFGSGETFQSVTEAASFLTVIEVSKDTDWQAIVDEARGKGILKSALLAEVTRDYGMYERAEAPQYYKDVARR